MQYQHMGYKLKGFYRWAKYALKWGMNNDIAQHRLRVLQFWEIWLISGGLSAALDHSGRRERALMREFEEYRVSKRKRLKVFRLEAVRAGFKKAWQEREYATIITVARKIPEKILLEDPKLLMWFDQALARSGKDA